MESYERRREYRGERRREEEREEERGGDREQQTNVSLPFTCFFFKYISLLHWGHLRMDCRGAWNVGSAMYEGVGLK